MSSRCSRMPFLVSSSSAALRAFATSFAMSAGTPAVGCTIAAGDASRMRRRRGPRDLARRCVDAHARRRSDLRAADVLAEAPCDRPIAACCGEAVVVVDVDRAHRTGRERQRQDLGRTYAVLIADLDLHG